MAFWDSQLFWELLIGFILTIIAVVIADMIHAWYTKPKVVFETIKDGDRLGFKVYLKKGNAIKDVSVQVNNKSYPWETLNEETGKIEIEERKNFYAGGPPSSVFPFQVNLKYAKNLPDFIKETENLKGFYEFIKEKLEKEERFDGLYVSAKEMKNKRFYQYLYRFPKDFTMKTLFLYPLYSKKPLVRKITIRIFGDGINKTIESSEYYIILSNMNLAAVRAGTPPKDLIPLVFHLKKRRFTFQ